MPSSPGLPRAGQKDVNPLNADALGIVGLLIAHTGALERGGAIERHTMELNPDQPAWLLT